MIKIYNILDYGVQVNAATQQTSEIQNVIDLCHENGGGEIQIPSGIYNISSLRLYSNITFHLLENAELKGSRNYKDYIDYHVPTTLKYLYDDYYISTWNLPPYYIYGIICAFHEHHISIIGEKGSKIDGQDCFDSDGEEKFRGPMGIILCQCEDIKLSGYTFENCANWSHQIDSCNRVHANNVSVIAGHDGFNLHHCRNIKIENCILKTGDDCFAGYDVKDLYVSDCYMNTACNVMRIGGSNLVFDHCLIEGPALFPHLGKRTYHTHRLFKYYSIRPDIIGEEGKNIIIKNSIMRGIPSLIQYEYGEESYMQNNLPLREFILENMKIEGISQVSTIKGNGEHCKLILNNVEIRFMNDLNKGNHLDIDDDVEISCEQVNFK